jgi:hypothetical protein
LRYQTTHERAFHKASDELRKSRNEKRKAEIGFESQKRQQAEEERREAREKRRQELHKWNRLYVQAKAEHQEMLTCDVFPYEVRGDRGPRRILATERMP